MSDRLGEIKIIDNYKQLDPEWFEAHVGRIGGSTVQMACAKGEGKTRTNLLYRKAGETLSGEPYIGYFNENMQRGIDLEPEARLLYELSMGVSVRQVAIVLSKNEHKICSPDGLVGGDGMVEIKCVIPSVHIETIDKDKIPSSYRRQIQWGLSICQREWCDFVSYCPGIVSNPIFIKRTWRDEKLIKELHDGVDAFIVELTELVTKIRGQ